MNKTINKKVILVIIIVFVFGFGFYRFFLKKEEPTFILTGVSRGDISQEVLETGTVKKGEEINLSFKNTGKIERIYVEVGQKVSSGEKLARLETAQLNIQLQEARATLEVAQAKLDKLLVGASLEEIQIAETAVSNAQITLDNARQNLKDKELLAAQNLDSAYEDALNVLDDSYLKSYNALQTMDLIARTYFTSNDQEAIRVRENKDNAENAISQAKTYLDAAKADTKEREKTDTALFEMEKSLEEVYDALRVIREISEELNYRNVVSSTHKSSLDTQREYINTATTNVTDSEQNISSAKLTNEANINTAKSEVSSAEGSLKAAEDELTSLTAFPRQEDVDLYQAQVKQAEAQRAVLENQIYQAILRSPTKGQVTQIKKRVGEMVQSALGDPVILFLSDDPFEIEVNIYEEDVVKMEVGNLVDISLVAFPDQVFKGNVISIDPAEKLIEGVVYYEAVVGFEETPTGLKPGMTADVIIKTAQKENVLIISEDAIQKKDKKTVVQILRDGIVEDREIETGLWGSDDMVEVVSGLTEGEQVILK